MNNTKKYVAPIVELFSISTKEECMLQSSTESTKGNITIDFDELEF